MRFYCVLFGILVGSILKVGYSETEDVAVSSPGAIISELPSPEEKKPEDSNVTEETKKPEIPIQAEVPANHPALDHPAADPQFIENLVNSVPSDLSKPRATQQVKAILDQIKNVVDESSPILTIQNKDENFDLHAPKMQEGENNIPMWVGDDETKFEVLNSEEFKEIYGNITKFLYIYRIDEKKEREEIPINKMRGALLTIPKTKFIIHTDKIERLPNDSEIVFEYYGDPKKVLVIINKKKYAMSFENKLEIFKLLIDLFKAERFSFTITEDNIMCENTPVVIKFSRKPGEELNLKLARKSDYNNNTLESVAFTKALNKIKLNVSKNLLYYEDPEIFLEKSITLPSSNPEEKLPLAFIFWALIMSNSAPFISEKE